VDNIIPTDKIMTNTQAHKALRNILANEYGINEAYIKKLINEKIEAALNAHLTHNNSLVHTIITDTVKSFMANGVSSGYYGYERTSFDEYVKETVTHTIQKHIMDSLDVTIGRK
jgi:hypothetical protein